MMDFDKMSKIQYRHFFINLRNYCGKKYVELNKILEKHEEITKKECRNITLGIYYNISNLDVLITKILDDIEDFYFYKAACYQLDVILTLEGD